MEDKQEIYFELFDSGDLVRLEPIEFLQYESNHDWDKNWVKTKLTIKGGNFSGQYTGEIMTVEFEKFKQEISQLYDNLKGTARFNDIEGYLDLKISGDGLGHFEVNVAACDKPGIFGNKLKFSMTFDQTEINELIRQLDSIVKEFPIEGNFKIKNE